MAPIESVEYNGFGTSNCNSHVDDHGWTKVVSRRRNQKQKPADEGASGKIVPNGRQIRTPKMVSADVEDESNGAGAARSKRLSNSYGDEGYDSDGSGDDNAASNENLKADKTKNPEPQQVKKPIVSLSEAAAKIDHSHLAAFLFVTLRSYADEPETQLVKFMDYIGRELTEVQFPWLKMFPLEGPWPKLIDVIDVPLSDIPEPIYKTSVDWIKQLPIRKLSGLVLSAFGSTLTHLAAQHEGAKSGKIGEQLTSPIPQVAIFVTLAMVLRNQPNALTFALRFLRERPSFQGQDKLPFTVWMMAQASQGGVSIGLYSWARNLLPVVGNMNCSPQSRDLILQLVEKILSDPKARTILMNRAVKEGDRVIPLPSFEILLRLTFPASSARVKATERFEAIYPLLKEVALAGAPGSKAMKQVMKQIFTISLKLAGEGNPALAKEATAIAIWSVTENVYCCKHWDNLYMENLEASVAVLKKLVDEWKDHSLKLSSSPRKTLTLSGVMKSFRRKNEKAITKSGANGSLYKEADKSCKVILGRLSRGSCNYYCLKATTITAVVLVVAGAAAAVVLSSNPEATTELKNLVDSLELHIYINAITTALKN